MRWKRWPGSFVVCVAALLLAHVPAAVGGEAGKIDFATQVQPILSDNCFLCHGPDAGTRKADLRLDTLDPKIGPLVEREDGYWIIKPGSLDDSVLFMRITSDDPETRMPPPESHRMLMPEQIDILKKWVEQGAKWGDKHWSLVAPVRPGVPAVGGKGWVRNPIDNFILKRLDKEGLKPSPEASKEALIRRVSLDLTGLPPTPEEVDAFVADTTPDAYEKVVNRLLASSRYGERMAWEWLDAARYADTNGYQGDPTRTMWPWRDWVVRAMNENLPYDQFITWQLAGDLLPDATRDQRLASGFNRNHPFNGEGGRIPEETRVENVMDRVETTGTAFVGLTIGCARCHDHKYDPISQKEYFQFYAYFNQSSETGGFEYVGGGNVKPVMSVVSAEEEQKLASLHKVAKEATDKLAEAAPKIDEGLEDWQASAREQKGWEVVRPESVTSAGGASLEIRPDASVLASGSSPATDVHEVVVRTPPEQVITGMRLEVLPDPSLPQGGPGRSPESGNFVLSKVEVTAVPVADPLKTKGVRVAYADATYSQPGWDANGAIDQDPKTGWAVWKAPDVTKLHAVLTFAEPTGFVSGTQWRIRFHYASEEHKQHTIGRFRLAMTEGPSVLPPAVAKAIEVEPEQRTDEQKKVLRDHYRERVSKQYKKLSDEAEAAKNKVTSFDNAMTKVMVMDDATPRETHVLVRGAYDKPGEKVAPGVLAVLNPLRVAEGRKNDRLALARWMVDPANPLTARVAVNRYWQQFFGTGIVKTVDDFGVQGERPVHPELLDWLAVEFRESGWDVKRLHRLIVTSATYRQSSRVPKELAERDPDNRLLARAARFRLPSVTIRDQALAASGLLVVRVGGPPVKPYQPAGVWEEATFGQIKYEQDHGEALYRRGLYVFWRRIVGPTGFFDAASRSVCTVKPSRTNTPLHALTTLNDVTYVEAARKLAERVMKEGGATSESRGDRAYRLVLSRKPNEKERGVLVKALDRLKGQYRADTEAARKLLAVGESKRDETLDVVEHAAWTGVCLTVLNLDEALTKE